ncbi:MAG: DNA topology modulation protein FlaR [Elusimicrobia bacterium]|nr:DNA topology modulation protein FlaR [Elusimicrobiota bacterium]
MAHRKIHIFGSTGSGKSYIADILSRKYNIPILNLDDIFWDNSDGYFGIKADPEKRDKTLNDFLDNSSWIVEGIYHHDWISRSFKEADIIIGLIAPVWVRDMRVIQRFLKRKMGLLQSKKKETWAGFFSLLKWNHGYDGDNFIRTKDFVSKLNRDIVYCKSVNEVLQAVG